MFGEDSSNLETLTMFKVHNNILRYIHAYYFLEKQYDNQTNGTFPHILSMGGDFLVNSLQTLCIP